MSDETNVEVPGVPAAPDVPAAEPSALQYAVEVPAEPEVPTEQTVVVDAVAANALQTQTVSVLAAAPSSQSETQQPEAAVVVDKEPLPLNDAVGILLLFVKAHRTAGDADLEAAVADVEASLAAQA